MTRRRPEPIEFTPIGVARTPFPDKASAPRQPAAARGVRGRIELFPDGRFEHALMDLASFEYVWVLFHFHLSRGWRAKVLPPRSLERRGVFATRAPHRPNAIGMSLVRLERIDGACLDVVDVDMVDGTPVLDIKPYLPYADARAEAEHGWLDEREAEARATAAPGGAADDPKPAFDVQFLPRAAEQIAFLRDRCGVDLAPRIRTALALGPSPHPYRRIKKDGDGYRLAVQDWRVRFVVSGVEVRVEKVLSGYRPSQVFTDPALDVHRIYTQTFGADGERDRGPAPDPR